MKTSTLLSLSALAASALAIVLVFTQAPEQRGSSPAPIQPDAGGPDAELVARLESLAEENLELRERLAMLEARPSAPQREPVADFASQEEFDAFREEVRGMLAQGGALPAAQPSSDLEEQVASTLTKIRKNERVASAREGLEKRARALDETMPKIERWLELTPNQTVAMRTALELQYEREAELVRLWEDGVADEILGEQKAADREAHRVDLEQFLDAEQLETYLNRGRGK